MKKQKFYRNNQIEHCDAVLITADKLLAVGHSALRAYGDEYNFGYDEEFKAEFITQIYNIINIIQTYFNFMMFFISIF